MRVLDLFCGAGGAAMGLHRAWPEAEIVGVDIKPQPHYPIHIRSI
jgi:DNA (cytosine-5)-methyltransferase 1